MFRAAADPGVAVQTHLSTSAATTTSSTDVDLKVKVEGINETPPGSDPTTSLQVTVAIGSLESHQWAIPVDNSDFTYDPSTGNASIDASTSELGGYGQVSLTATPISDPTTTQCADGSSMTVRDVGVQGLIDFATASSAWGRVTEDPIAFSGTNQLVQEFGTPGDACFNPAPTGLTTCTPSIFWSTPYGSTGTISGGWKSVPHGTTGLLTATNEVTVTVPGAPVVQRTDTDIRHVAIPIVTVWPKHSLLSAAGQSGQEVIGTATVKTSGPPAVHNRQCSGVTVTSRAWKATLTPGAHPLTIKQAIGGPIVVSRHVLSAHLRLVTGQYENSFG